MTYLVDWDGVKIADDHRTLLLLASARPGAIVRSGCGTCASCTGVEDVLALEAVEPVYAQQTVDSDGRYGTVSESGDWVVPLSTGEGMLLRRDGSSWEVSQVPYSALAAVNDVEMAPWYHASNPATGDFLGAIVTDMQGALDRPTSAKVLEGLQDGGWISGLREGPREVRVKMTLMALSEAGLNAGQAWIAGSVSAKERDLCTSGSTMRFGVSCPGEGPRWGMQVGSTLGQITDRQLVGCYVIDGPKVAVTQESCGLWTRSLEIGVLSGRGKLMRPTINHLDHVAGTSGPGVVVQTITTPPALCPPDNSINVMRDPNSTIPSSPVPPPIPGDSNNRTTFSHKKRVTVPIPDEPWTDRALKITLHAPTATAVLGARVRVFPMSNYTPCGEVAEFYVQYVKENYALVVDGIEGALFAWRLNEGNWAQASHLVRSIYPDGYFVQPVIGGGDGFYVVVESQGDINISVESAAIE